MTAQGMVAPEDVFADRYADVSTHASHVHDLLLTTGPAKDAPAEE